jgi:hypothetical protein
MRRPSIVVLFVIAAAAASACGGSAAPSTAPSAATPAAPSVTASGGFALRPAPEGLGCDAMGVAYRSVTFKIDPAAADAVTAVTDQGGSLRTFWSVGFVGGSSGDAVVRDPDGQVVATDGEVLAVPEGAWPRLHGYFVCPSPDALYVLLQDPS